jgi:hypothetical protein
MPEETVAIIAERMSKGGPDSWLDVIEIDAATGEVLSRPEVIQAAKQNGWRSVNASLILL